MQRDTSKSSRIFVGVLVLVCFNTGSDAQEARVRPPVGVRWVTPTVQAPRLERRVFRSDAAKSSVSYHVYTPEAYETEKQRRFPVLYWLHGSGGGAAGIRALVKHFGDAIREEKIPPVLVVFPNGLLNGMWCDSKDGRTPIETILIKELVPDVDTNFRTIPSHEARMIEGFSMGGYGAARLGFKHPCVFGIVSILAGGPLQRELKETPRASPRARERLLQVVYGGDQDYFRAQSPWRLAESHAVALRDKSVVRLVVGDRDKTLAANRELDAHLTRLKIPHTFTILPGIEHNPRTLLQALGDSNWEFYRTAFSVAASDDPPEERSTAHQADAEDGPAGEQAHRHPAADPQRR